MKAGDIKVGFSYLNKGAGRTMRTVVGIGDQFRPDMWFGSNPPPDEPGVLFTQSGMEHRMYLSSFVKWCGREQGVSSGKTPAQAGRG
jgi:hypothetical protein